ncbi:MAG: hypothetical protein ABI488_05460 [Polyangiaceae bacterium]
MRSTLARHSRSLGVQRAILVLLIVLSGLAPRKAFAEQPGLTIRWDAPARCPQQNDLSERVRKLSGSATAVQGALQAEGTITQAADGRFYLTLLLRSGGLVSERYIDSRSCADLTRAAAVAISLLLHPDEPLGEGTPAGEHLGDGTRDSSDSSAPLTTPADERPTSAAQPTPSELPKRTHELEPAQAPLESPTRPAQQGAHVLLRAPLAALSLGPLPRPEWGVSLAAGVSFANWRLWLEGSEWLQQDVPATAFPGYAATVNRATLSLRGCRASRFAAFEFAPCVVVALEHLTATGAGEGVTPQSQHVNWLGAGVGAQGRVYLTSWLSLALSADGIIETSRPRLAISGVGVVDQLGSAGFEVMLGPEWIL